MNGFNKRPLAILGGVYLGTMLLAVQLPAIWVAILAAGMLVVSGILLAISRIKATIRKIAKQAALLAGAACLALFVFAGYRYFVVAPITRLAGTDAQVTARVVQTQNQQATLQVLTLNGQKTAAFTVVVSEYADIQIGDMVETNLSFFAFGRATRGYNYAKNIFVGARASTPLQVTGRSVTLLCRMRLLQHAASANIQQRLPGRLSSVAAAMAVGDIRFLSAETKAAYRAAGLSHLLVVSGMHLSVLSGGLYVVLRRLARKKQIASALCILFILVFMAFTGFSPSVVRSGIAYILVYSANLFHRRADIYTSLGLAALLLCTQNPYASADIGVLLSFSATLGALAAGKVEKLWSSHFGKGGFWLRRAAVKTGRLAIVPTIVTLATLPVLLLAGLGVSPYSVPVNIVVLPLLGPVVLAGLVAALPTVPIIALFGNAGALVCGALLVLLEKLTNWCSTLPAAQLYLVPAIGAAILLLYPLALLAIKSRRFKACLLAGLLLLGLAAGLQIVLAKGTVRAIVVGSGSASSLVVCKNGQAAVLYRDRRNLYNIQIVLKEQNIREVTLFVDLRATASSTEYETALQPAKTVVAGTDVISRQSYAAFGGVMVYIIKQGDGMAACANIAGYTIGIATGNFNFGLYGPLTVLVSGRGKIQGQYGTLLCLGAPPQWAAPSHQTLVSSGQPVMLIRPGGGLAFREVTNGLDYG